MSCGLLLRWLSKVRVLGHTPNGVTRSPFGMAVGLLVALTPCWAACPEGSRARRLFCLACGLVSTWCILAATALWVVKKLPAHCGTPAPGEGRLRRCRHLVKTRLAQLRKAWNARLRDWHNSLGACSAPLAILHASFRGGSLLTMALLLALGLVLSSGFLLAYQYSLLILKSLGSTKAKDSVKEAAETLESSRRLAMKLHRSGTLALWTLLALHLFLSCIF
jgi:hypothetical protein